MTPTRPWRLVLVAVVCAAAAWLAVRATFAGLPPLPWTAVPALLLLAVAETWAGRNLGGRIRGTRPGKPLDLMAVARMAVLAKATSHAAAAFGGLTAGFLVYVSGSLGKPVPRSDAITAAVTLAAAAALVAAALYLEYCCRAPTPPEGQNGGTPGDLPGHRDRTSWK